MSIKIHRQNPSSGGQQPSDLLYGEIACDKDGTLYVGNSSNVPTYMLNSDIYNQVGNPNLLDNTNFKNPVAQRGSGSFQLDWKYCIDRWVLLGDYNVGTHTLTFDAGNQTSRFGLDAISYMRQGLEKLDSGTYTLSAGVGGNVYSHSFVVGSTVASQAWNMGTFYFTYEKFSGQNTQWFGFGVVPGTSSPGSVALDWIKLEAGDTATPYVPKGYGAELAECLRYFQRVYADWRIYPTLKDMPYRFSQSTLQVMRIKPTISAHSTPYTFGCTINALDAQPMAFTVETKITERGQNAAAASMLGYFDLSADI